MPDDFAVAMSAAQTAVNQEPLALKLARVMGEIGQLGIQPDKRNDFHKYRYFSSEIVFETVRPRLAKLGIIVIPSVVSVDVKEGRTAKDSPTWLTTLQVEFTIVDGHTGKLISGSGVGQGDDPGDKGANKAMTGAFKFFLLKLFEIGGEADAEEDEATDRRADAGDDRDRPREREGRDRDRDRGRDREDRGRSRDRNEDDRGRGSRRDEAVEVGDSNIEGIQRGGRANYATEAQLKEVRSLARDLGWKPQDVATEMARIGLDELSLDPDDYAKQGPQLVKALEALRSTEIGELIDSMVHIDTVRLGDGGYGN